MEFWFATPHLSEHSRVTGEYHIILYAYDQSAHVIISMPANSSFINKEYDLQPYESIDVVMASDYDDAANNFEVPFDVVSQRGIHITSTSKIGGYYQHSGNNSEAFSFKDNAAGTDFLVTSQISYETANHASYVNAYSSIQIVATEDNTVVTIIPKANHQLGLSCNDATILVHLNRGETYAVRSCNKNPVYGVNGTQISSNKKITVTCTDDSTHPVSALTNGFDLVGEQIVPISLAGNEYVVIGQQKEWNVCYITAIDNNSIVTLGNGTSFTLQQGETKIVSMSTIKELYISSSKPIILYQVTGEDDEAAGTVLPTLECTGSSYVVYKKLPNSFKAISNIIVRAADINKININGIKISSSMFHSIQGTSEWYYASIDLDNYTSDLIKIESNGGLFQLGVLDMIGTSLTNLKSCSYGYFSDYGSAHEYDEYDTFEEGTTYVWNNHNISGTTTIMTFTSEGEYRDTLIDVNGCDSICVLHLSLCHRLTGDTTATFCNGSSFSWHDVTYSTAGDYTFTYTSKVAPYCDSIVTLHLTQLEPSDSIEIATICAGDAYTWHGQSFTISTTTTESLPNTVGCDSICTLQLTVLPELVGDTSATICNGSSFTWHDVSYSTAGDYTYTYTSHVAPYCDSTVTLHLIQLEPSDSIEMVTICEGETYTWHGNTYTSTTDITETITNATGCDSVCTLHLKVNPKQTGDTIATFCNGSSFMWHGVTYSTAGNYPYTYTSKVTGCDSIVTLHLTQLEPSDSIEIATICVGETYTWHGKTFTATTTTTETIPNAVGCDSVCTLHLTIMPPLATSINETITEGATYLWNGQTYSEKGTYTQSFTTAEGCDSIVTLHLTVNPLIYDILVHIQCADDPFIEFDVTASDGLFNQLQFVFTQKAIAQHFRDTIVDYSASQILIPNSARAGIYEVAVSPLYNSQVLDTHNFQFTLLYPSSVLDQHWDDFIGVLTHNYNGGYDFVGFQWYKNGQPMVGENHSYTYQPLEMGAAYSAMLEEQDGTKLMTCEIIATPQTEISVYPTLLQPRQIIRLHSSKDVTIWLYDNIGKLIYNETFSQGDHHFAAPQTSGVYIIRIQQIGESGKTETRKLIVK